MKCSSLMKQFLRALGKTMVLSIIKDDGQISLILPAAARMDAIVCHLRGPELPNERIISIVLVQFI